MNHVVKALLAVSTAVVFLSACDPKAPDQTDQNTLAESIPKIELAASGRPAEVDTLIDGQATSFFQQEPLLATDFGGDIDAMGGAYNHRLPDYSPEGAKALQDLMRKPLVDLNALDTSTYDYDTRMHIEILKVIRGYFAGSSDFAGGYIDTWGGHLPYVVNQISGPLIDAANVMQNQQPLNSVEDAKDYLTRLAAFGPMVDGVNAKMMSDADAGIVLPKKLFPKTLLFIDNFTGFLPGEHPLVVKFNSRLSEAGGIDPADVDKYVAKASALVTEVVYPAYERVKTNLMSLEDKAPAGDGIWAQPGGSAYYKHALKYLGDTEASADEIHDIGLSEVARISAEMDSILAGEGLTKGTVGERMSSLADDSQFVYADSDEGREALLADLRLWTQRVMDRAPEFFATLPTQAVEIKRVPLEAQASAAGGFYNPPSLDGKRPGVLLD